MRSIADYFSHILLLFLTTTSSNWLLLTFNLHDKITATANKIAEQTHLFLILNSRLLWVLLRMNYKQEALINKYICYTRKTELKRKMRSLKFLCRHQYMPVRLSTYIDKHQHTSNALSGFLGISKHMRNAMTTFLGIKQHMPGEIYKSL
jgi:hypothetical protein